MMHHAIDITPEQKSNLLRLAEYLEGGELQFQFDMNHYCRTGNGFKVDPIKHECGSVACAVGHGPSAGIEPLEGEDWDCYSNRVFGTADFRLFVWLFSYYWAKFDADNTPRGAAARIRYALEHGIPENHEEQSEGRSPLSYTVSPEGEPT